jgi:hypothetical protein
MSFQRTVSCITGVVFAIGFAATQASAGTGPEECPLAIDINALRGGSPTVSVNTVKNITSKARIAKGSAPSGTTMVTQLVIEAIDGDDDSVIDTKSSSPITLGVGKGGQGDKLGMQISRCNNSIDFVATFTEVGPCIADECCTASESISKTCK